ncbi:MAG TPA: hypothetical protein VNT28_06155 [Candidatus Limnocylindrales bacterium]|nr:hypothetical protein [Candidatus Limnocylindrales bacterium]
MNSRDRQVNAGLLVAAAVTWAALVYVLVTLSPVGNAAVLLAGALLMGMAVALTLVPLLWLAGFARNRSIAYRGDWWRAARRGLLAGFVVALFVLLRGQDELSLPLAVFILAMAALAEVTLTLRR